MLRRLGMVLSLIALSVLALSPCLAFAAGAVAASEKVETVNVTTSATGAVDEVEVEATLKNAGSAAELLDASSLTGIEGADDATYTLTDEGIVWQAEGEDVTYTGTTEAQLPVSIKVTYRLDGKKVSPADIAGKSGDVSIRYDFANEAPLASGADDGKPEMFVPFTCITALMFDGEGFTDVAVENGKVIDDGSDVIVAGYAMPGLKQSLGSLADNADIPDHFEVTAKARDFELKSTMTIVTAGLMSDLDVDGLGFDDLDDVSAGLDEGMSQLVSGADELTSGMRALADGADALSDGADGLASGAQSLSSGLYLLAYGNDGSSGLKAAASGSQELVAGLSAFGDALSGFADDAAGLPALSANMAALAAAYPDEAESAALVAAIEASDLDAADKASLTALVASSGQVKTLSAALSQSAAGASELSSSYSAIVAQAKTLPAGVAAAADAAAQLHAGAVGLSQGAGQLSAATGQLAGGIEGAADGSDALAQGLAAFDEQGISKIVSTIDDDLGGLRKRLKTLSEAASAYDSFSGKAGDTPGSVKFVYQTAAIEVG